MASFLSAPKAVHEAPWIELFGTQVLEDAAVGTVVGDLFARSDDGSPAKFQLLDDADGRFRLEGTKLVVAESGRIDYETLPWLPVTIRCTDAFGAFRDRTFNLQVRDVWEQGQPDSTTPPPPEPVPPQEHRAPDLVRLTGDWVGEITNTGFIVGTIKAYDADGDALTYTLADDADGRFTIINNALVVADGSRFDFETAPTVDVRVRVTDATGLSAEKTFTIQVMDRDEPTPPPPVNHAPQDVELTGRAVIENASTGTMVGAL
ncbi:cadherin repeat domain-containing protein [Microvirga antarctica]|uniref:cadherin repeat domain-containing protein n=1 Tax=Microvirga antarctica TaxID=2819233 RepID=UPI001B30669F|nr:cadherin repeat domain-containing protein [Microvirga antarctica]